MNNQNKKVGGALMLKRLVLGFGLALMAIAMAVAPALAYVGTPGASCATSSTTVVAGGSLTFTAHFLGGADQVVTFSASGGGPGTVVTFNPASATTDASGNVSTTVTFGTGSSGTVTLTATTGAQNCSAGGAVSAFPAASSLPFGVPAPLAWIAVLLAGAGLVGASLLGRRRAPKPDIDKAA
jgi:hypothetical protein